MKITGARNEPFSAMRRRAVAQAGAQVRGASPVDSVEILGISEAEMTPAVSAAVQGLLGEIDDLRGGTPDENAAALRRLLDGEKGPYRDIVLLNAAAALLVADKAETLADGIKLAASAIDSGCAKATLEKLAVLSHAS